MDLFLALSAKTYFFTLMYGVNTSTNNKSLATLLPSQTLSHSFLHLRVPQGQVAGDEGGDKGGAGEICGEAEGADGENAAAFI